MENNILLDDWLTRYPEAISFRKKEYLLSIICTSILLLITIIGMFITIEAIVLFILALITFICVILEWLKIQNNHLIIKNNQIEITNRFKKTKIYEINLKEMTLEIRPSFNRKSGAIIMKFYDKNNKLICKYEDRLNRCLRFGKKITIWEEKIKSLGIKIIDVESIMN